MESTGTILSVLNRLPLLDDEVSHFLCAGVDHDIANVSYLPVIRTVDFRSQLDLHRTPHLEQ